MAIDLVLLQTFAAIGITQPAVRLGKAGKNVKGMGSTARKFCSNIDLQTLPAPSNYQEKLDEWTRMLQSEFPEGGRYWGVARKCINIFMRDASYNIHLRRAYPSLENLENVLEVPLDSYVAKGLLKATPESPLKWEAVIRLKPDVHRRFQSLAQKVADRMRVARVDLDIYYFRQNQ